MDKIQSDANVESKKERKTRELALEIALHGVEEAKEFASPTEISRAEEYLASLASMDGRKALGEMLTILKGTIERAHMNGDDKIVIAAATRYAELAKLAEVSDAVVNERATSEEREAIALGYLESTGVIKKGLDLLEASRLLAQYVVDEILPRKIQEEAKKNAAIEER